MLLGPVGGLVCGLTFGLTSFYQALTGGSAFTATLLNINPVGTFVLTVVTRALVGWLTGLIFKALHSVKKVQPVSYYISAIVCPFLNTLLFMSTLVLIFYSGDYIQSFVTKLGVSNPLTFVIAFVGAQGLLEAVICGVVAGIVGRILYRVINKM